MSATIDKIYHRHLIEMRKKSLSNMVHLYLLIMVEDCENGAVAQRMLNYYLKMGFNRERIIFVTRTTNQTEELRRQLVAPWGISARNIWQVPAKINRVDTRSTVISQLIKVDAEAKIVNVPLEYQPTSDYEVVDTIFRAAISTRSVLTLGA